MQFQNVLRKCLRKVSSVFQENFIKSFKDISRIFKVSFAILLHESHRSFLSRRRACYNSNSFLGKKGVVLNLYVCMYFKFIVQLPIHYVHLPS